MVKTTQHLGRIVGLSQYELHGEFEVSMDYIERFLLFQKPK